MKLTLPHEGPVSVSDVAEIIRSAPHLLNVPDTLEVRAILYRDPEGTWVPFRRSVRVGTPTEIEPEIIRAGALTLVPVWSEASAIGGVDALRESVWGASLPSNRSHVRDAFGDVGHYMRRQWSELGIPPAWRVELPSPTRSGFAAPPSGPFANPERGFIAENIAEAAAKWFGVPGYVTQHIATLDVDVTIYDKRAYFRSLKQDQSQLVVTLDRAVREPLDVWVRMIDNAGRPHEQWARNVKTEVRFELQSAFRSLRAYLFDQDATPLDLVDESSTSQSARANELFGSDRAGNDRTVAEILERGESDVAEVKAWMPVEPSDAKSIELLQTACAFAHTRGGDILIGVTDQLSVVGVHREVQKLAVREGKKPGEALDHYAHLLRKRLNEGIHPSLFPEIEWVQFAGHDICRIHVPRSTPGTFHALYQGGLSYVRRGANTVPATGDDILRIRAANPR